ncbi:MAG: hypothetical protein RRB13_11185 [bacterium]|nr:hypothetical protein [bacterium]
MSDYRTEKALRRLVLVEQNPEPLKVTISPLAKQKANGKEAISVIRESPEEEKARLGEERTRLRAERLEQDANRLLYKKGITSRPLSKPNQKVMKLVDED